MSSFTSRLEVSPQDDGKHWRLIRTFVYAWGKLDTGPRIRIPAGFITDFASSPRLFWPIVSPWGKWGKAAIVHDWLYQNRGLLYGHPEPGAVTVYRRDTADLIFLEAMKVLGVAPWRRTLMYLGVRAFGFLAWRSAKGGV